MDDQLKGRADKERLNTLRGNLFGVSTSKEAQVVVQQMIQVVTASNFCLLSPDGVASQCQSEIKTKQERHRELNTKCAGLDLAKTNVLNQENYLKKEVTKTQKKAVAAKKKVPIAEKRLKAAQDNLDKINQAVKDTKKEKKREWFTKAVLQGHTSAQTRLNKLNAQ